MKSNRLLPLLWVVPLAITALACPTRSVPTDASDGGGVDSASDRGAASGAGGMSGASGNGGASGAAGRAETGGALGTGGAIGAGGVSGAGGMSGTGGNAGAAGEGMSSGSGGSGGSGGGTGGSARDGQPCSLSADCTSGTCSPFYADVDGDGYGAGPAMGFCGTTAPVGYAAQSGDCCDSAPNLAIAKLIHPGADFQTTSAGGTCNITWDYDCSDAVESNPQSFVGCAPYPACSATFTDFPESSCGTPIDTTQFCAVAGPSCTTSSIGHPAAPIRCK